MCENFKPPLTGTRVGGGFFLGAPKVSMSTATQIAALEAAIETGIKTVTENGRTVTYHSLAEMQNALSRLHAQQNATTSGRTFALTKIAHGDAK